MTRLDQLAADAGLTSHEYDYALPVDWCRAVDDATGTWPPELPLVWCYALACGRPIFGHPRPLTPDAAALLARYAEATP